jgi:hypothetical protein
MKDKDSIAKRSKMMQRKECNCKRIERQFEEFKLGMSDSTSL